jgi:hypothetical protein
MLEVGIVIAALVIFLAFSAYADKVTDEDREEEDEHGD